MCRIGAGSFALAVSRDFPVSVRLTEILMLLKVQFPGHNGLCVGYPNIGDESNLKNVQDTWWLLS